jgi:hypothetical protein
MSFFCSTKDAFASQDTEATDCTSDELLARMMQQKFDEEYVSNQAYPGRTINHPPPIAPPSDEDDYADEDDDGASGNYSKAFQIGRKGYACVNGHTITKHDAEISGYRNMQKLTDNMPLSSTCGDAHTSQVPLSNKIYNDLRRSALRGDLDERSDAKKNSKRSFASKIKIMFFDLKLGFVLLALLRSDIFGKIEVTNLLITNGFKHIAVISTSLVILDFFILKKHLLIVRFN